ncbi:TetR/AcrR family transcriptional regulator [Mycolicibacterium chlorophenolicum]|uniref:HTH-type transcriptional repressor KstR2 n=1 Tax=Mycolicibacterium chlorophenolicum TaxID=37916 RepID=A0A0J6WH20_9MYCO|nr:TetR/AcrR family transcriptional regulator [Mycolicibacterium chlorophenolicum]KMO82530.1 HTH-type transcriptional repressor KstR2 [Mycolicibacterium chlorophenolicum]
MTRWPSDDKPGKVRDAALAEFAGRGVEATSLREVAARAGVSVGLIQHHFGTKGDLVDAVNRHVTDLLREVLASGPEPVTVDDFGEQVMQLFTKHTVVADYLARALVDDTPFGAAIFDTLIEMGVARWRRRADAGQTVDDLDVPWAAMNMVVLVIGTVLLRPHIERQLAGPLLCPDQLDRWGAAVKGLMSRGYLRPGGSGGGGLELEGGYPAGVGPAKGVPTVQAGARKARTSSTTRTPLVPPARNR